MSHPNAERVSEAARSLGLDVELAAAAGGALVGRVGADAVRAATGYPIGGVPPFGHAAALRVFCDADLCDHEVVWAAAGTPRHVFSVEPDDLVRATGAVVTDLGVDRA